MAAARRAFITLALAVPAALFAQAPAVQFTAPVNDNMHVTSASYTVTFKGCTASSGSQTGTVAHNGGSGQATSVSNSNCIDYGTNSKLHSKDITLSPGANTIVAQACHNVQGCGTAVSRTIHYDTPQVSVTPDGANTTVIDGNTGSYDFTVTNTGQLTATASFGASCGGNNVVSCSTTASPVSLSPGAATTVTVTFVGSGAGSGSAWLNATYQQYSSTSNDGYVNVTVNPKPVATVSVTNNGAGTIGIGQTSSFTARTYLADGTEVTGRTISWAGSLVTVSPGSGSSAASTTATGATVGSGSVSATSEGVSGSAGITVASPSISATIITTFPHPLDLSPGATSTGGTIRYRVRNTSQYTNASSTFALTRSWTGIVTACEALNTTSVALAPNDESDFVTTTCSIGATAVPTSGTVTFTATTAGWSGSDVVTVNATPFYSVSVVRDFSSKTEGERSTGGSTTFKVYNNSVNAGGSALISLSRACTSVASCSPASMGTVTVTEGSYQTVTLSYDVAWVGTSGFVRLTGTLGAATSKDSTTINTTPTRAVIVTRTKVADTLGVAASSGAETFTIMNNSTNTGAAATYTFTPTCSAPFVTGCNGTPASIQLDDQQSTSTGAVALNYYTGLTGISGSVTLLATSNQTGSPNHSATTTVQSTPSYTVSVATESYPPLDAGSNSKTVRFTVTNTSTNAAASSAYTLAPTVGADGIATGCSGPTSVTLAQNQASGWLSYNCSIGAAYQTGSATLTATASAPSSHTHNATANLSIPAQLIVTVAPAEGSHTVLAQRTLDSLDFTVTNTSRNTAGPIMFAFSKSCSGVSACPYSNADVAIAQGSSASVRVKYNVNLFDTGGSVGLTASASSPSSFSGNGAGSITTTPHYGVIVTPAAGSQTLAPRSTTGSSSFRVKNTSTNAVINPIMFTLAPACTDIARPTSCGASASTVQLAQNIESADIDVTYSVDSIGTTGVAALGAAATSPAINAPTGVTNLTATPSYTLAVIPGSASQSAGAGTTRTFSATIKNTSWNSAGAVTAALATPGCTNVTLGSCVIPSNSTSLAQGTSSSAITLTYDALANGNETVALNASGTVSGGSVTPTNGSLAVAVSSTGTISATTAGLNPGTTIDRGACLTIAAGQNAAYECGDLRVVHALPAAITMNKAQAPTLIYNSRHAKPGALLAANVTYNGVTPLTLHATVTIAGQPTITKVFNFNSVCEGQSCRIVVPIDATPTMQTGIYTTELQVEAKSGGFTYATSPVSTDTIVIVNRSKSLFGAGWWLAGLESMLHLSPTKKLWVGGDGSTRLYTFSGVSAGDGDSVYTVSPQYDRPDTLRRSPTLNTWRRHLGNGAYVGFDNAGRHTSTANSLGWRTIFTHYVAGLDSAMVFMSLPVPQGSGAGVSYTFTYNPDSAGQRALSQVTPPRKSPSFPRVINFTRSNHFLITGIVDSRDASSTTFGYDGSNRLTHRRNTLADTTFFEYDDAGALKLARLSMARTDGAGAAITTTFKSAETRSAASASDLPTPLALAYTLLNGPRPDSVGDTTRFYVNRRGAPDTIVTALNQRTRMWRRTAQFPALVDSTVASNGLTQVAYYNTRALTDSVITLNPYGDSPIRNAKTTYAWHSSRPLPVLITSPTGDSTSMGYNTTNGALAWRQRGTDAARRDSVLYNTTTWQVVATVDPFGQRDSVFYDAFGNTIKTKSPLGFVTEYVRDGLGRDTLSLTPTDATQTANLRQRMRTVYGAMDRLDSTIATGPAVTYSLQYAAVDTVPVTPDSVFTQYTYDLEGRRLSTAATHTAEFRNPENSAVKVQESWFYDAAGRVRLHLKNSGMDSLYYDAASNVVRVRTASGGGFTQTFDVLNRVTERVVDSTTRARQFCEGMQPGPDTGPGGQCFLVFPAYPNAPNGALKIARDVATFTYDAFGNMIAADNGDARVHRRYFPNGALKVDSSWTRDAVGVMFGHLVVTQAHYDLSGRRDTLRIPTSGLLNGGAIAYSYSAVDGALSTIVDPWGTPYHYVYDLAGRVDSIVINEGAIREKRWYDADHRQYARNRVASGYSSNERFSFDAQGRVKTVVYSRSGNEGFSDSTIFTYSGLGAVLARERLMTNMFNWETEEFRVDGLGNVRRSRAVSHSFPNNNMAQRARYGWRGELTGRKAEDNPGLPNQRDSLAQQFDADGHQVMSRQLAFDGQNTLLTNTPSRSYYGADGKLRAVQRHNMDRGTWEEYRYDAFGRRVMVIARPSGTTPGCTESGMTICNPLCAIGDCQHKVTWQVWDGDQLLREERGPYPVGGGASDRFGTVHYVHGLELDKPLAVLDDRISSSARILNPNWRGLFEASVSKTGEGADCTVTSGTCSTIPWPAGQAVYSRTPGFEAGGGGIIHTWSGSLLLDGQDGTGNLYRRNRYYDPVAGRFTQEDPIGLAGGMNLYGFAAGDPVNYGDPFGLCVPWPDCMFQAAANWGAARGGAVGGTVLNASAAANAASEAIGTNELGRAIGDRSVGGIALAAASFIPGGKVAKAGGDAFGLIMKHVGDDALAMLNEAGDLILQSKNGLREVRFDFNNPSPHKSPHVHVIEYKQVKNKKVETRNDRVYPSDVPKR